MKNLVINLNANKILKFCSHLNTNKRYFHKSILVRKCRTTPTTPTTPLSFSKIIFSKNNLNFVRFSRFYSHINESIIKISDEIESALNENRPVVALESTIITHGMPYPVNLQTAQKVEQIIRTEGVIPATIAVIKGQIIVGIDDKQLAFLSESIQSGGLTKISRSDLPLVISNKASGGTTVSATSLIANRCGIDIFVTGGIGGVHRGVEHTLDISADLTELGRTPITVICAGVKSILDIPKTLEFLETQGVCVMVFNGNKIGAKVEFPAFFSRKSGSQITNNIESIEKASNVILERKRLGLESGIVIAVPIPEENQSIGESVNRAINEALNELKSKGIVGKEVTPYVLERVNQLSEGTSLKANIALIDNNARIGAKIAVHYQRLISQMETQSKITSINLHNFNKNSNPSKAQPITKEVIERNDNHLEQLSPVIIGGSIYDIIATANTQSLNLNGSTYKGSIKVSLGGVGRNIFDCLSRLGLRPIFLTAIGNDSNGETILKNNHLKNANGFLISEKTPTSSCSVVVDGRGECGLLVGDMRCHELITREHISKFVADISRAPLVVIDANISTDSLTYVLQVCSDYGIPVWYEPTDINLCSRIFSEPTAALQSLLFMSPNYYEFETIANYLLDTKQTITSNIDDIPLDSLIENCYQISKQIMEKYFHSIAITLGKFGVLVVSKSNKEDVLKLGPNSPLFSTKKSNSLNVFHLPQEPLNNRIVNVSGAGDCFASAMIYAMIGNKTLYDSALIGLKAAKLSLLSSDTIPNDIGLKIK